MMRWVTLWTMGCLALLGLPARADAPALVPEKTIPLHSVSGRIDHMAFDRSRNRLMVAELGNNSVEVVDVAAGTILHRIAGLREPQGIGYAERADVILVANAADGSVRLFAAKDFAELGSVLARDGGNCDRVHARISWSTIIFSCLLMAVVIYSVKSQCAKEG